MSKKPLISGPILIQIWTQKIFFHGFYPYIDIATSYHNVPSQGELMIQIQENDKKLYFGSDLGLLGPIWSAKFLL